MAAVDLHQALVNPVELRRILVEGGHNLEQLDENGFTPLMNCILQANINSFYELLIHGASPNAIHQDTGDTPLHMAVRMGNIHIVKALVVYGADLDAENLNEETARHQLSRNINAREEINRILEEVGARRCTMDQEGCWALCRNQPVAPQIPNDVDVVTQALQNLGELIRQGQDDTHGGLLLCFDGGGIRGLIMIQLLLRIEKNLIDMTDNATTRLVNYVTFFAGTSTGAILALALAKERNISEIRNLYFKLKDNIFEGSKPYPITRLEAFLRAQFGDDTMNSIDEKKVMIMVTQIENTTPELRIFRSYASPENLLGQEVPPELDPARVPIYQAAVFSASAPYYFRIGNQKFLDGGLVYNNPTVAALTELSRLKAAQVQLGDVPVNTKKPGMVLSLGNGISPADPASALAFDLHVPSSTMSAVNMIAALPTNIPSILSSIKNELTNANADVVLEAQTQCNVRGIKYFRLTPTLSQGFGLTEKENTNLFDMLYETEVYLYRKRNEINDICQAIIANGIHVAERN